MDEQQITRRLRPYPQYPFLVTHNCQIVNLAIYEILNSLNSAEYSAWLSFLAGESLQAVNKMAIKEKKYLCYEFMRQTYYFY